ncbi:MAG: hypothetical protein ACK56J_11835 [Planctomycetota bacterium]|jgi:hypothetical protein
MDTTNYQTTLPTIAAKVGVELSQDWRGLDSVLALIDMIRGDGAVFLLKFDGQRTDDDSGQFTVVVSGGPIEDHPIRIDARTLEDALAYGIIKYAEAVWLN